MSSFSNNAPIFFSENLKQNGILNLLEDSLQVEVPVEQPSHMSDEFVFLNHVEDATAKSSEEELAAISVVKSGDIEDMNAQIDQERQPQNGAEAYENLVKSLTECDADYMKDIAEDTQIDDNFGLIDNNILDQFSTFSRDTGLFQ